MSLTALAASIVLVILLGAVLIAQWRRPALCVVALLLMFPLEQWAQSVVPGLLLHRDLINVIVGALVMYGIGIRIARGQALFAYYPVIGYLALGLFAYALASALWAPPVANSLQIWWITWPYIVATVVVAPLTVAHRRDLRDVLAGIALVGGALVVLLLFSSEWKLRWILIGGEFGNPLAIGYLGGVVALVVLLGNLWPKSKLWSIGKWLVVAFCLALIVRSASRGQLLALLVVALGIWPLSRVSRKDKVLAVWGVTLVFVVGVAYFAVQEYWASEGNPIGIARWSDETMRADMAGRFDNAIKLLGHWASSPVSVVIGLGSSAAFDPAIIGFYPHILPLEILAEEGLIGFSIFVLMVIRTLQASRRMLHATRDAPQERATVATYLGLFLFAVILSCKEGALLGTHDLFLYAILIGKYEIFLAKEHAMARAARDPVPSAEAIWAGGIRSE